MSLEPAPKLSELLSETGPLADVIPGFAPREAQTEMSRAVEEVVRNGGNLVVEAGTGTGKTFAYLLPALLSGKKTLISTGTKNLQDQLFYRDLPTVCSALKAAPSLALLKGRANYLCLHRLQLAASEGRFQSREQAALLEKVKSWSAKTRSGDLTQMPELPENDGIIPMVTSTSENCLGTDCELYDDCYLVKARRKAMDADLVVVNHHLLMADMVLKEDGFGELLPTPEVVIVDEAHQLPETATLFYGQRFSSRQLLDLLRDCEVEYLTSARDAAVIPAMCRRVERANGDFRLAFGQQSQRGEWRSLQQGKLVAAAGELVEELQELARQLESQAARSKGLESCHRRALELCTLLKQLCAEQTAEQVHWFETFRRGYTISTTPLEISDSFRQSRTEQGAESWIFTSATLAVGENFEHFLGSLGLDAAEALRLTSPFDFARQSLLYVPRGMPDTGSPGYTDAVLDAAVPLLKANNGRAFLLFTSHRALQLAAERLRQELDLPLLVQGEAGKNELLEAFRVAGNAVLLGTGSFWEGVDVKGDTLSIVVIDKLPFASPGDPLLAARIRACRARGGDPFEELQIPLAVLSLNQGSGRLIRDASDWGLLVLCDPRLVGSSFGRRFLQSLPPLPRTRSATRAREFLQDHEVKDLPLQAAQS